MPKRTLKLSNPRRHAAGLFPGRAESSGYPWSQAQRRPDSMAYQAPSSLSFAVMASTPAICQ